MIKVLMTSTKPFEREVFESEKIQWTFSNLALNAMSAKMTEGFTVVCIFVSDKIDEPCLQQLKEFGVKLLALRSAGFNHVDLIAAKNLGIDVVRVPRYSPNAVAEFAVGLYLSLNRKIPKAHDRVKEHNFSLDGLVGHDVYLQTIGIIGAGAIGKCVAQIFRGFGSQVQVFDPDQNLEWAKNNSVKYVSLEMLLQTSDVVSLHAPLSRFTKHLINRDALLLMKKNSYLINTSRGGLVDTKALIEVLKNRHLTGAALDVYEEEENIFFKDHSDDVIDDDQFAILSSLPNVLLTSHQAFLTHEALNQIARTTIDNIVEWNKSGKTAKFF